MGGLNPCPRCGSQPKLNIDELPWVHNPRYAYQCPQCGYKTRCGIVGRDIYGRNHTEADAQKRAETAWNAQEEQPRPRKWA